MAIGAPLASVLAAGRAQFNQRVTEARHRYPAFDTAAFGEFVATGVDMLVLAVAALAPDRVAPVAHAAFDIALELVGQTLAGSRARHGLVNRVWEDVLPEYARLVAAQPVEVMGMLTNAAVNIGRVDGARPDAWLRGLVALAPRIETLGQLQAAGQVLAWRAGLAHLRTGALAAADSLGPALALAALGGDEAAPWPQVRAHLLADPWWTPDGRQPAAGGLEIGRFAGFGGDFPAPPAVRAVPDGFVVASGERYGFLVADAFGAVLHAATRDEFDAAAGYRADAAVAVRPDGLTIGARDIILDLPAEGLAVTCNAHTAAVTSPFTHAIRLLPLQ